MDTEQQPRPPVVLAPARRFQAVPNPIPERLVLHSVLFLATFASTFLIGSGFGNSRYLVVREFFNPPIWQASVTSTGGLFNLAAWPIYCRFGPLYWSRGLQYAMPLMFILTAHELGHFLMARWYRIRSSLPFFIPMPLNPMGTMGAVIAMRSNIPSRRALFDVGIAGPIAGLIPTIVFTYLGLSLSQVGPTASVTGIVFGKPLLLLLADQLMFGPLPPGQTVIYHPIATAAWVGVFLTAFNLLPIGQLDGGHVLYGMLGRHSHRFAQVLLMLAIAGVIWFGLWHWWLMLVLLVWMGPKHPPTRDDSTRLGKTRIILGWLMLLFVPIGFTPTPFLI